jgi:hypothetical protein
MTGAAQSVAIPSTRYAPRQPCPATSQATTGAITMPPREAPSCERPSAVARAFSNQLTTIVVGVSPVMVPAPKASSVPKIRAICHSSRACAMAISPSPVVTVPATISGRIQPRPTSRPITGAITTPTTLMTTCKVTMGVRSPPLNSSAREVSTTAKE